MTKGRSSGEQRARALAVLLVALSLTAGCSSPAHGDKAEGIVTDDMRVKIGGRTYTYYIEESAYPDILLPDDQVEVMYVDLNQDGKISEDEDVVAITGLAISDAEYEERMRTAQ